MTKYCEDAELTTMALTLAVMEDDDAAARKFKARLIRLAAEGRAPSQEAVIELRSVILKAYERREAAGGSLS